MNKEPFADERIIATEKAYKNLEFLNSPDARSIRVLCEFIEPETRFRRLRVRDTIVFFGSSRAQPPEVATANLEAVEREMAETNAPGPDLKDRLERARRGLDMSRYYEDAADLAERLARWSQSLPKDARRFIICSGGGPGIMEAANRGANKAGAHSAGLNISLPFEQAPNPFQSSELAFEFHYFFIRKFWFVYLAKAIVAFPGGFGTMDELIELLTLVQTQKLEKQMPIVVYGQDYWNEVINFDAMARWGMISPEDVELFQFFDDVDSTFEYLKTELTRLYL